VTYLAAMEYTFSVTAPVFIIVFLGLWLKQAKFIGDEFIQQASSLVFNLCLPMLIFLSIQNYSVDWSRQFSFAIFCVSAAVICFAVFWFLSGLFVPQEDRGVAVQGAFRSNLGIIGLALCAKAFDGAGLAIGAVILAVVTPVFNVLSVYGLNHSLKGQQDISIWKTLADIVKNPLIIAIALGFLFSGFEVKLPIVVYDAGSYLAQMTLPLALICIGGALSLTEMKRSSGLSAQVVFAKLVIVPVVVTFSAYLLGFKGVELGCILLMFASPTATASFIMVRKMGGNYALASNIIVISSLCSALSISILLYLAKLLEWF
jgi:malonate transporter